ncbi:hypothetical protein [Paraburkholderia solisilvae]|uniref:Uncharacterized protein n=1 Tax=Paraburkholderia solisilvae TaxID=624376 RepID=A0A6J5DDB0_9BURK|nr:hypothetical protein [Paraburkholderia solisilvae]CAB3752210.1 hypothetical protein LMG29739_01455 [Paraburkholderia solisilvae]
MRKLFLITTSVAALALTGVVTSASAQSTNAQPSSAQPASAGMSAPGNASGEGPGMTGMTASGTYRHGWPWYSHGNNASNCVGPISFCNVYFGGG